VSSNPKRKNGALLDRHRFLLRAQVEVNRAVSLSNIKVFGIGSRSLLDPGDYCDDAIDTKIHQAIDALQQCLVARPDHGDAGGPSYTTAQLNGLGVVLRDGEIMSAAEIVEEFKQLSVAIMLLSGAKGKE